MAGYVMTYGDLGLRELQLFHIDTPNLAKLIHQSNNSRRVVMLQLDGDELEAALWGLENYGAELMKCQPAQHRQERE